MTDFEPHFIPCRKLNCVDKETDSNTYPCSKCIDGTKWIHFRRAKTPITYETKDFSFDDMRDTSEDEYEHPEPENNS